MRRPWSPDPLDRYPVASGSNVRVDDHDEYDIYDDYPRLGSRQQRREVSETSVEALDLADYARTLRTRPETGPYPSFPEYPPTPRSNLHPSISRDSLQPPSLISRNTTQSSNAHSSASRSRPRPFSLPPSSYPSNRTRSSRAPQFPEPQIRSHEDEIDVAQFPPWSRNWYDEAQIHPPPDIYTPLPGSHLHPQKNLSPWDPSYNYYNEDYYPDQREYTAPSSLGHESTRELLPWSKDASRSDIPIDPMLKEERIKMLEREFGPDGQRSKIRSDNGKLVDDDGKPLVGTVDPKGNLVTQGPKKRAATRLLQIILAAAAAIPSIYAAAAIKSKLPPPPANKPPAYVLYVFSVLTLLLLLFLFVFRPCCCPGKRQKGASQNPLAAGIMALPIQTLPGGKGKKKKQKGKKGNLGPPEAGDVQVNLIVDPRAFGQGHEESSEEEDEWNESLPGAYGSGKKRRRPKRRGVFEGLAMEEDWKRARSWTKKMAFVDVLGVVVWGAVFVFIMIGKRCPSGSFEGWCNAYNTSTAAACLLCVAFGFSVFFDVKDLSASKASPRTRT